jgi:REP element-mobilizing transposase RayT
MDVREKKHRLPKQYYQGEVSVAFTLCTRNRTPAFLDNDIVAVFTDILSSVTKTADCIVPVYCFMPDHNHIMVTGTRASSDVWSTIVSYKQKTGYWMSKNRSDLEWQKDFYDTIIKTQSQIGTQVRYILDNPVRKGLVPS